jgi:hypothetical protein
MTATDRVALLAAPLFGFRCFWRSRHPDDVTASGDATYRNNVRLRTMFQGTQDVVRDHMRVRHSSPPLPSRDTGLSTFRGYLCIPRECQAHCEERRLNSGSRPNDAEVRVVG